MKKKIQIGWISLIVALLGMLSEYLQSLPNHGNAFDIYISRFQRYFSAVELNWINYQFFFDTILPDNNFHWVFYILFLIGSLTYLRSVKESRLLEFGYAIILISNSLQLIAKVWNLFAINQSLSVGKFAILWGLDTTFTIAWILLSYKVLKVLNLQKEVAIDQKVFESKFKLATKWQRLINQLLDVGMSILVFTGIIFFFPALDITSKMKSMGVFFFLPLFIFIASFLYYLFFEFILGATPGKYLSGTRVLMSDGSKPPFQKVLLRNLIRFIPVVPLSFMWNSSGYHDQWSNTKVVRLKNPGVHGGYYLLVPVVIASLFMGIVLQKEVSRKNRVKQSQEASIQWFKTMQLRKKEAMLSQLAKLGDNYVLHLKSEMGRKDLYLKVEEIGQETVELAHLDLKDTDHVTQKELEDFYQRHKERSAIYKIKRSELTDALQAQKQLVSGKGNAKLDILNEGIKYRIIDILPFYESSLNKQKGSGISPTHIVLSFKNQGNEATVIEIDNLKGQIQWETPLPLVAKETGDSYHASFTLVGTGYKKGQAYKFALTVKEQNDKIRNYLVEGQNERFTVNINYENEKGS